MSRPASSVILLLSLALLSCGEAAPAAAPGPSGSDVLCKAGSSCSDRAAETGCLYPSLQGLNCTTGDATIRGWYQSELDRCPDDAGLQFWMNRLRALDGNYDQLHAEIKKVPSYVAYRECRAVGGSVEGCYAQMDSPICCSADRYVPGTVYCRHAPAAP